jgi:hypothetical protein
MSEMTLMGSTRAVKINCWIGVRIGSEFGPSKHCIKVEKVSYVISDIETVAIVVYKF